ncbi:hypothetical protein ABLE68_06160 [Nocardioides sp. CN2-186]|uniref:hypothetical protein n=1 Tax=Nocardioides tweenelious TaxID=3156607 RepID=UPI0032B44E84
MLTDEDLTRQLSAGYRDTTDHLSYAGKVPAPRSIPRLAVPVGATVAAAAVLTVVATTATDDSPAPTPPPSAAPSVSAHPKLVTSTIKVAGYTFTYRHAVGDERADDLYAVMNPGSVPDDATPISAPSPAKAWVGTDPESGDHALWVDAPTRNDGQLFEMLSPTWTTDQLADLFHNGDREPLAIPAITR